MQTCAQVLVTAESLASDSQYSLARDTFRELLEYGAVPIVNENVRQLPRCPHVCVWQSRCASEVLFRRHRARPRPQLAACRPKPCD